MSLQERIERQLNELESLQAIYFEDKAVQVNQATVNALRTFADKGGNEKKIPVLEISVCILGSRADGDEVRVHAKLPHSYPDDGCEVPEVWLKCQGDDTQVTLSDNKKLVGQIKDLAQELCTTGEEGLLPLMQQAAELCEGADPDGNDNDDAAPAADTSSSAAAAAPAKSVVIEDRMGAMQWTKKAHLALEEALSKYPMHLNTNARWQAIAGAVPGKTKRQCVDRYLYVREMLTA